MRTETEMELAWPRQELAEVKQERDLLKTCAAYFAKESQRKRPERETATSAPGSAVLCRVMNVSESGYHAWRKRLPSACRQETVRLETEIRAAHRRTRETY